MVSPQSLERAYRTVSIGTFVASFGFALWLGAYYLTRTLPWGRALSFTLFAPFLIFYTASAILFVWSATAYAKTGERAALRGLLRPGRWVLAGHLSFILQAALIAVWLDRLKATIGPRGPGKSGVLCKER